jgi:hypothetical protein
MELRFVAPHLRQIDLVGTEVLACALFSDQMPPQGVVGLVDWRMAARLSRYLQTAEITGNVGEIVLIPGKPRVPFEKFLLFGAGRVSAFDENVYFDIVGRMLAALGRLRVRMAVVERPGRHLKVVRPSRAVELLFRACGERGEQDAWTLVEDLDDQKDIAQHLAEERRRTRMR